MNRYDGGDFLGRADNVNAFGAVVAYHVAKGSIPLQDIAGMAFGDGPAPVPDGMTIQPSQPWTKVCLSVPVQFDDHEFGDLGLEPNYALPGVRFRIEDWQGNTIVSETWANHYAPSCVTVPTDEHSYIFHVHADSLISDDGREYRVATFDLDANDGTDPEVWADDEIDDAAPSAEVVVFTNNHAYDTMAVSVSFGDADIGQVHATSSNLLQRWEYLSTGQASVPFYFDRLDVRINAPSTVGTPQFAAGDTHERFLIGHEVGHIWHQSLGASVGSGYAFEGIDGVCISSTSGNRLHMLRSAERAAPASEEAVAHLLATVGFNYRDDPQEIAEFFYYKSTLNDGNWNGTGNDEYEEATNLVVLSAETDLGVATAPNIPVYLYDHCGCEEAGPLEYPCNELGVELDWLRFLWAMLASESALPGARPPLDTLVEDVGNANDAFTGLLGTLNGGQQQRALQAGCIYLGRCL